VSAPIGGVTVREALDSARIPLQAAGCESPRLDAELLLAHVLGVDRAALVMDPDRRLGPGEGRAFAELVRRRREREPVAYLVGRRAFRHLELEVDRRVLIPRPETELLVEAALELPEGARVVDVGAGSGAVALALKQERPDLDVHATDASEEALAVARANAARLGLEVAFARADLLEGVDGPWDAVLANLPYIADDERPELAPEITHHEPDLALFGGGDGLGLIGRLIPQAAPAPFIALELAPGQVDAVGELLWGAGWDAVEVLRDLAGHERVVLGRRRPVEDPPRRREEHRSHMGPVEDPPR
jgi:release factor glutamine methyltransferase